MLSATLTLVTFLAVLLVAGNNLSACVGTTVGCGILSKRYGALLGAVGFTVGLLMQGQNMTLAVRLLLPANTMMLSLEALSVTILIFLLADFIRAPLSLTVALVGLLVGISIRNHLEINNLYFDKTILMWFLAPIISALAAFYMIRAVRRTGSKYIWRRVRVYKVLLIVLSVLTSYVLGANTIGLIVALGGFNVIAILAAIFAIFAGSLFFSSGEMEKIGQEMFQLKYSNAFVTQLISAAIVEFATVFGLPLSNTQTLTSAVFGAGMTYSEKLMSLKPFVVIVLGWIIAPLLSFALGFLI